MNATVDLNNIDSLFPSNYLKASDFPVPRVLIMQSLAMADMAEGKQQKPVITFVGEPLGWVLNKTNAATIKKAYGSHFPDWIGKPVQLFSMQVQGPNGIVDGIRCLIPAPAEPVVPVQPAVAPVAAVALAAPAPEQPSPTATPAVTPAAAPVVAPVTPAATFTEEEIDIAP